MTVSLPTDTLAACQRCDTLVNLPDISNHQKALCPCCNTVLHSPKKHTLDKTLAISFAGLLLLIPATVMPLMGIYAAGQYNQASLLTCIVLLANEGFYFIAFCVFIFAIAVPAVRLFTAFYLTFCLKYASKKPHLIVFFRSYHLLNNWAMIHVFFLGIIVSLYKLVDIADIAIGTGITSIILLLMCSTMLSITLDHRFIWQQLEQNND
ncbi:paraquat-inducible protein A [Thalassotalea sp. 1_MG-2023]|uniref:paraquat-inducible protein A n=1 Tax=Thalassotalea sp. 1_MG-2023 TaxID=3062680 RepID=UPI0026E26505|nr:paraquat-inducible protein A [Thalassotalea sp. 1_MG-2023]MDO6426051.1 paraquat-inducible protein A [Thalassotalea sp. 1_MG-2023]